MRTRDLFKARAIIDELLPHFPESDRKKAAQRLEQTFKNKQLAPFLVSEEVVNNRAGAEKPTATRYSVKPEYKTLICNLVLLDTLTHNKNTALKLVLGEHDDQIIRDQLEQLLNEFSTRMYLYQSGIGLIHKLKNQIDDQSINYNEVRLDHLMGSSSSSSARTGIQLKNTPVELHALQVLEEVEKAIDYDPTCVKDMLEKARYYIKIEQARPAYDLLQSILSREENHSVALMLLAQVHLRFKDQLGREAHYYQIMHQESEPCSAAERHYDEMATESAFKADDEKTRAFQLMVRALKYWPKNDEKWGGPYEESSLRDQAKSHLLHLAAGKCDPDVYEYEDKLLAKLDLYADSRRKYRIRHAPKYEGHEVADWLQPTDKEILTKDAELKAAVFFDPETDAVLTELAQEQLKSRGTLLQDLGQRLIEQIDSMKVLQVLAPEQARKVFPDYVKNLQNTTDRQPEWLNRLMACTNGYGRSLRRQLVSHFGKDEACKFIDKELPRISEKNESDAATIKLNILDQLAKHYYDLQKYDDCYQCCLQAIPSITLHCGDNKDRLNFRLSYWYYRAIRCYVDKVLCSSCPGVDMDESFSHFIDTHYSHIEFLLQSNKSYMIKKGAGDYETGYDEWHEDPFGNEEQDIFVKDYDDRCLFRDFLNTGLQQSKKLDIQEKGQRLLTMLNATD